MIKGQIVIIIGGTGLLGVELAKKVIDNGGIGIIGDINLSEINEKFSDYMDSEFFVFYKVDICSKESVDNMINKIVGKYNKIDAVINCSYPRNNNYGRKFEDVEFNDFCENIKMHLGGYFLIMQQFASFFYKQGYGNIINIASIYGVVPPRFEIYDNTNMTMPVEYAAIKSAVIHLTKYVAKYYKGCNIRINCISPGGILNNQPKCFLDNYKKNCLNRGMLHKSDINGLVLYLLSDSSKMLNGQNIVIDDGFVL